VAAGQSTAEGGGTRQEQGPTAGRLAAWLALVGVLAALNYAARFSGETTPDDVLYKYSTAVSALVLFGLMLGIVLAIARFDRETLALRPPRSWGSAVGQMFGVLITVYLLGLALSPLLDPGEEQGLTPDEWDSSRAAPFFLNVVVVAIVAPIVEELTFRGLGYSLLVPFGAALAIFGTALAFALGHGLLEGLPVLFVFGAGLAYIRHRQDSVVPGIVLHGTFNAIALAVSVST
jgi:membrane protease YdiL (CAAX protease family)